MSLESNAGVFLKKKRNPPLPGGNREWADVEIVKASIEKREFK